ncbi:syntaxin-32 isoform X1 [Selaginella moellendorffii]|uniref:syntaxin-32 isoform X1 n=1 Tax=Selaginella moellendorffii TaxID=88036 RepID=UPI000D1D0456|nr:syntaxin-32 isoform X1 [Selaginella moellendorffii]|eukprot:XP_024540022.1 syntaxin-32 isoform X1 [Selaginella moellendorffii]
MPVAVSGASSCRDRTSEFQAIAERLKRSPAFSAANGSMEGSSARAGGPLQQHQSSGSLHSEFNRRASQIGLSIHQTSNKLHKLTQLAKKTSIFDDPAVEIQELTAVIRQDIQALNSAIEDLQRVCDARNEINRNKHSSDHSTTVVGNLKTRLMDTTKEFKDVLTLRSESLKVHEERMKIYSTSAEKGTRRFGKQVPVNGATTRELFNSRGVTDGMPKATHLRRRPGGAESSTSQASSSSLSSSQSQTQTQQLVPTQDHYLHSRAEALRNVESTIAELGNIFSQLATMVAEQGEVAIRIDENMDDTLSNVDAAQGQLLKYLNGISSNRWLIVKIFFVLLVFLLVFVFFVA